jgi:hypothetical protein
VVVHLKEIWVSENKQPSFVKSIALALATVALSTWALGSLWMNAESAAAADDTHAVATAR